jgi:hypothetical protein
MEYIVSVRLLKCKSQLYKQVGIINYRILRSVALLRKATHETCFFCYSLFARHIMRLIWYVEQSY